MKLDGNTVLITGGATGIGFALAEAFLEAGSQVIVCSKRKDKLAEAQKKHPAMLVRECDVSDGSERDALVSWLLGNHTNLNILVNNACIQNQIDFRLGREELLRGESEIHTDLETPIYLCASLLPHLLGQESAAIINVTSVLGIVPLASLPVYCAAKAGLHAFTKCLRKQLSFTNVQVFEVIPPTVAENTPGVRRKLDAQGTAPVLPSDYAASVLERLEEGEPEIIRSALKEASAIELEAMFEDMNSNWQ